MWTTFLILCCGIPAAVCWMIVVEEYLITGRRITRARLVQRGRKIFGAGLISQPASLAHAFGGAFRLFAWTAALGSVLAEMMSAWPASQGIAVWLVVACGGLEIVRYLPVVGSCGEFSALLRTMTTWLTMVCALAGLGFLFGSYNLANIANVQAQAGSWVAIVQPLGCAVFLLAVGVLCLSRADPPQEIELIVHLQCIVLALLTIGLFGGGWYFWGITTYTTDDTFTTAAVVLRAMVVAVKLAAVLCGLAWLRTKCAARQTSDVENIAGNLLLAVAGTNLMIALTTETWLRPDDFMTRGLLSWIVAGGMITYGLMFHRTHVTALWKGMVVDKTETGC
ncbi:hypothetical protein CA54_12440 [Symmachiella macrocystis]|uniref:Uncharacterized protein n=1 Tax=Symmachiella macrocystis TaxID=2527985 RepID=A0A5C6BK30_9PLAN|nr:hypothetical protein [Symmachiella macrocystis]TWU12420.1 hypothetical protein CA54_12440 [Symmachiella macrocystis]